MLKIYHFLIAAILLSPVLSKASNPIDSIGMEVNNGKKIIIYKVEAKETYYSIAKKYNIAHFALMEFNDSKLLNIGETIKVPTQVIVNTPQQTNNPAPTINNSPARANSNVQVSNQVAGNASATNNASTNNSATNNSATNNASTNNAATRPQSTPTGLTDEIIYTVKAKDNLNLIAKQYQTTVEAIKELNNLSSNNLQIGQQLKIRSNSTVASSPTNPIKEEEVTVRPVTRRYKATVNHKVKSGETLGHIAQKYDMSVEGIKKLNKLKSNSLQIGQSVKVEVMKTETTYQRITTPIVKTTPILSNNSTNNESPTETNTTATNNKNTSSNVVANNSVTQTANNTAAQTTIAPTQTNNTLAQTNNTPAQTNNTPAQTTNTTANSNTTPTNSFEHQVVAGETIYSIAKKYNLTTYQITTANNLSSNNLSIGQKLIIKGTQPVQSNGVNQSTSADNTLDEDTLNDPKLRQPASRFGLTRFDEKGTAVWISDPDLDETKMLVLHRTAPIGTIIRITNPMTNRSAFAKVVGKFTENETTKDVIIVLTKIVADAVGALDKRFYCNINYGAVENE